MSKRILLASTHIDSPANSDRNGVLHTLRGYLEGIDAVIDIIMIEELNFFIKDGKPTITNKDGKSLEHYDIAYIKNWRSVDNAATALTLYLESRGCRVLCSELKNFRITNKVSEAFLLALNDIPYPDTFFTLNAEQMLKELKRQKGYFTFPMVVKAIDGSAGEDNYLVEDYARLCETFNNHLEKKFMVQNLINNDGDHRIIMVGYEPKLSFKRSRLNNTTHLNNTSQGATAVLTKLSEYSEEIIKDCEAVCRLVGREIAGVDILIDLETNRHVVLEVNSSPQLSSGVFLSQKKEVFRDYIQMELQSLHE